MDTFIPDGKNTTIRTFFHSTSKKIAADTRAKIMGFLCEVWPWNKPKGLDVYSAIKVKGEWSKSVYWKFFGSPLFF